MFSPNLFKYIVIAIQIIYIHNQKQGVIMHKNDKTAHKQHFSFLLVIGILSHTYTLRYLSRTYLIQLNKMNFYYGKISFSHRSKQKKTPTN